MKPEQVIADYFKTPGQAEFIKEYDGVMMMTYQSCMELMKIFAADYARIKCAEQRGICAKDSDKDVIEDETGKIYISVFDVIYSPAPDFD